MTFRDLLSHIYGPSRYLGNEINSVKKDPNKIKIRFALAFPDAYEIGMSHLGIQILYYILNQYPHILAERVFAPDEDLERLMRKHNIPLCTLESNIPLRECHIIGFSLQHELCYTNILNMLNLAGIPIYARQRDEKYPLIIAGGPIVVNPEPIVPFFDGFFIGDGEEGIIEIVNTYLQWQRDRGNKEELLQMLSKIEGFYTPFSFYPRYQVDGVLKEIEELQEGYAKVKRRIIKDLDSIPFPSSPIVPYDHPVHDRLSIEVARGCTQGCRFCQAGFIYRPVRERSPETVLKLVSSGLKNTGYEEISLLSLSIGDYQPLAELIRALMNEFSKDYVAISLPSLRIGTISKDIIEQISRVRRTGLTLAPEAATQKLRNIINKKITEEELFETAKEISSRNWPSLKLYFMIGLPQEGWEDIEAIVALAERLSRLVKGKLQITASISTFVPKPHTPFQWERQISLEESKEKIKFIKRNANRFGLKVRWHEPEQSFLEGVFSRGDRRLHEVILRAWMKGARFDSWKDRFKFEIWQQAFADSRLDPNFYLKQRGKDEPLPWDMIDIGVNKEFLWNECLKARRGEVTQDCRYKGCQNCGLCDFKEMAPKIYSKRKIEVPIYYPVKESIRRYRFTFSKVAEARFLGHLELINIFHRAFRRAGIRLVYSKGFHPLPFIVLATALPVGIESLVEKMDVKLYGEYEPKQLLERVNPHLPLGICLNTVKEVPLDTSLPVERRQRFIVDYRKCIFDIKKIALFDHQTHFPWQVVRKGKVRKIDLKDVVKRIVPIEQHKLEVILDFPPSGGIKLVEALQAILNLNKNQANNLSIIKMGI